MDDVNRLRADLAALTDEVAALRARLDAIAARNGGSGPIESMAVETWSAGRTPAPSRLRRRGVLTAARFCADRSGSSHAIVDITGHEQ